MSALPWDNNSWDVAARIVPMRQRANIAALVPNPDPWLGIGTRMGSQPVLLGISTAALLPVPLPTYPARRDLRVALNEVLRTAWPRVVATWRYIQKVRAISNEIWQTVLWL